MAVEYGGRVLEITVEIDEWWMTVAMIGSWAMMEDWNDDERRLEELEPVAPCGGNAFSLRANALPVSATYAACRAGVLGGYGLRGAGVWASFGSKAA